MKIQSAEAATSKAPKSQRKTVVAARFLDSEMRYVNAAVQASGGSPSNWLRERALSQDHTPVPRQEQPTTMVLLEELAELRSLVINLFRAALPPEVVANTMAHAKSSKHERASEVLCTFQSKLKVLSLKAS
jgi:hypothetical protein